jgi:hypothetical protein
MGIQEVNYDLSNKWLRNCLDTIGTVDTPDRILSLLSILDNRWKLSVMTVTEKIDEEFAIFDDRVVFMLDGIESSGMDGKWKHQE